MDNLQKKLNETEQYIIEHVENRPDIAITLGSGLNKFAKQIDNRIELPCEDIPNYPVPGIQGHEGQLVFGNIENVNILGIQGRSHYYEGRKLKEIVFPIDVMNQLDISQLILTNAAGGINKNFKPTDLVLIDSYLNFTQIKKPFLDSETSPFNKTLNSLTQKLAREKDIKLKKGTYCWTTGPNFETRKEIEVARKLGADMVGMSTVPELQRAAYLGQNVIGISLITNMAAGIDENELSHQDVQSTAQKAEKKFYSLMLYLIKQLYKESESK